MALVLALAPPKGTHEASLHSEFTYQVYVNRLLQLVAVSYICTSNVPNWCHRKCPETSKDNYFVC